MRTVLIAGAGKSSTWVIDYMLVNGENKWKVIVMDIDADLIHEKLNNHPNGIPAVVDIHDDKTVDELVSQADIVLTLLPHDLHIILAKKCLKFGKNMISPSYVSDEMRAMDEEVRNAGLMFMCEMGLDPGIDHMSAAQIINGVKRIAGVVTSFKSYCGGLISSESDDNPWKYKLSWNPRNVVLAGIDGANWKEDGKINEIDYNQVFDHVEKVKIPEVGNLLAYPNRDSLWYQNLYEIEEAKTILRATLRYPLFIKGWRVLVKAGLTDDMDSNDAEEMTYAGWVASKTKLPDDENLMERFKEKFGASVAVMNAIEWLRIFEARLINGPKGASSAVILQGLLERRWKMRPMDKDLVVVQHEVEYDRRGQMNKVVSSMVVTGEDKAHSAMAKCVGLPMAILAKKILVGEIDTKRLAGVHIPIMIEIYRPVLRELKKHGIEFVEELT